MAKTITRIPLTLFGASGAATNFGQFGSQLAGTPIKTKDVALLQSLAAWVNGWQNAVASGNTPYLEDLNAIFYVHAYMQAYMLQEGVPEYDASTSYFIGSIVKRPNSPELYSSLTDANLGNALPAAGTSNANWQFLYGLIGGLIRMGGPLAMNSQKITGLANGTVATDAAAFGQIPAALVPGQIAGTSTNDSATAGNIGESVKSLVSGANFPATNVWGDATSFTLSAGDWDVTAVAMMSCPGVTGSDWRIGITTTAGASTAGLVFGDNYIENTLTFPTAGNAGVCMTIANYPMKLAVTTIVYFKYFALYTAGTPSLFGRISARRIR